MNLMERNNISNALLSQCDRCKKNVTVEAQLKDTSGMKNERHLGSDSTFFAPLTNLFSSAECIFRGLKVETVLNHFKRRK